MAETKQKFLFVMQCGVSVGQLDILSPADHGLCCLQTPWEIISILANMEETYGSSLNSWYQLLCITASCVLLLGLAWTRVLHLVTVN